MLLRYNNYVNSNNHHEQFTNLGQQYSTVMEAMTALGSGSLRMTRLGGYDHLGLSQSNIPFIEYKVDVTDL